MIINPINTYMFAYKLPILDESFPQDVTVAASASGSEKIGVNFPLVGERL